MTFLRNPVYARESPAVLNESLEFYRILNATHANPQMHKYPVNFQIPEHFWNRRWGEWVVLAQTTGFFPRKKFAVL